MFIKFSNIKSVVLLFLLTLASCYTDYMVGGQSEDRTIREQIEVEVLVEVDVLLEVDVLVDVDVFVSAAAAESFQSKPPYAETFNSVVVVV